MPGRVAAIHVKDRIEFGNYTGNGMPSLYPFSDDTVRAFRKHGFVYFGRITITTDVVRENNQTYRLGWTENSKDGTKMGVGLPEYLLLFRKLPSDTSKGYADDPVVKSKLDYTRAQWQLDAHGFWKSNGNRPIKPEDFARMDPSAVQGFWKKFDLDNVYDYELHVAICEALEKAKKLPTGYMITPPQSAHPDVWTDVTRMRTLNSMQSMKNEMFHLCPLQFDIVERSIGRYSMPGELICDPFGGLMTVPYCAINMGRRGYGIELNADYFRGGISYLKAAEHKKNVPTLFDLLKEESA